MNFADAAGKVWLVGGSGMLGQALQRELRTRQLSFCSSGHEVDITEPAQLLAYAQAQQPSHIINCAAMTAVDACQTQVDEAMAINGAGAKHVAALAAALAIPIVHVSTDYVFAGDGNSPYTEEAACAPKSVYGQSKWQGEQGFWQAVAQAPPGCANAAYVVRTSWLFGHGGGNFAATMLRLMRERPEVSVVADQFGRPTFCKDLAVAILALLGLQGDAAAAAGTYHFANAGAVSWHGFAQAIFAEAQARKWPMACTRVVAVTTEAFVRPAPRPSYSVMSTDKLARAVGYAPRPFAEALAEYFDGLS